MPQAIRDELAANQGLIEEVNRLGEPFEPEERAADVGLQWAQLETSLERLSERYGHAAADWMGVEAELDDIHRWATVNIEWTQLSAATDDGAETLARIQVPRACLFSSVRENRAFHSSESACLANFYAFSTLFLRFFYAASRLEAAFQRVSNHGAIVRSFDSI